MSVPKPSVPTNKCASNIDKNGNRIARFLVLSGSFNPPHVMHQQALEVARRHVESVTGTKVVVGFLAPSSDGYVRDKLGPDAIPLDLRCAMCQAMADHTDWVEVCNWGWASGPRIVETILKSLQQTFPRIKWQGNLVYGADFFVRCGVWQTQKWNPPTLCVGRAPDTQVVRNGLAQLVTLDARLRDADGFINGIMLVDEELGEVSSTAIRHAMHSGNLAPVQGYLHPKVLQLLQTLSHPQEPMLQPSLTTTHRFDISTKLDALTRIVSVGHVLGEDEVTLAVQALTAADVELPEKKAFLLALNERGVTADEISRFARKLLLLAKHIPSNIGNGAIDIVGTGGDKSGSANISSVVSFLVASAGQPVVKMGNRAATSKCGAADLLEHFGLPLAPSAEQHQLALAHHNFTFLFAPHIYDAFKEIVPARRALAAEGHQTIFNILGPLLNPSLPSYQLTGAWSVELLHRMAHAFQELGRVRGAVVHCDAGNGIVIDELSCAGTNYLVGFGSLRGAELRFTPEAFGLQRCDVAALQGGSTIEENVALVTSILANQAPRGLLDTVLLNAGVALWVADKVESIQAGIALARTTITSGVASAWLDNLRRQFSQ